MNLFDAAKSITSIIQLGEIVANAAKAISDPSSTPEEKADASKASVLAKKKIANSKAKGGAVTKMYNGGMAHGRKHMYLGGDSSVKDNAGLRALKKASPEAYMNIKKNA